MAQWLDKLLHWFDSHEAKVKTMSSTYSLNQETIAAVLTRLDAIELRLAKIELLLGKKK
jgi:hypothetical protein